LAENLKIEELNLRSHDGVSRPQRREWKGTFRPDWSMIDGPNATTLKRIMNSPALM